MESHVAAPAPAREETEELDLHGMSRALKRRKSWIVLGTASALAIAAAFVVLVKPHYTANSQVLIENQTSFLTAPVGATIDPAQPPDDAAVASQIQLLTSRDLARRAISALRLADNPEFNPHAKPGLFARIGSLLGFGRAPSSLSEEDQILQNYYDRLTVFQVEKSRVVEIDFTSQDPALAARAANEIADLYISVQISTKQQTARSAAAMLGPQVVKLQNQLASAEDKAETFQAASGLLAGPNNTTLSTQQLSDLNTQLAAARAAEADAQAKAQLIRSALAKGRLDEISDISNNELVRQIALQRVNLRAQLALESRTLLPEHPQIKELKAQIADLDQQLRSAAVTVARGLENDARLAQGRYDSVKATLDQQKRMVGDSGADQVKLRALDRDAKSISDQLEATMTKYQDALAQESAVTAPGDARVISRAIAPQLPTFPRKVPTLVFAGLAGLVLSAAAVLAAELLSAGGESTPEEADEGLRIGRKDLILRSSDLERRADPAEPLTPRPSFAHEDLALDATAPLSGDLARVAAQAAALSAASERAACLLVLGLDEDAAAGAAAEEIGRRLASEGRTILVELAGGLLEGSRLDRGEPAEPGLGELTEGSRSFAEVIERDPRSRLHFIRAGLEPVRVGESLDVALEALGETYDHVILLAPPLNLDPLTRQIAGAADLVAIVAGEQEGADAAIDALRTELVRAGAGRVLAIKDAPALDDEPTQVSAA